MVRGLRSSEKERERKKERKREKKRERERELDLVESLLRRVEAVIAVKGGPTPN